MLVHGFCFFKLVFIGPKELKPFFPCSALADYELWMMIVLHHAVSGIPTLPLPHGLTIYIAKDLMNYVLIILLLDIVSTQNVVKYMY